MDKKIEQALQDMSSLKFAVRESAKNLIRHELDVQEKMVELLAATYFGERYYNAGQCDNIQEIINKHRTIAEKEINNE